MSVCVCVRVCACMVQQGNSKGKAKGKAKGKGNSTRESVDKKKSHYGNSDSCVMVRVAGVRFEKT